MRAQWVCSKERRIAVYKRSSISQSFLFCQPHQQLCILSHPATAKVQPASSVCDPAVRGLRRETSGLWLAPIQRWSRAAGSLVRCTVRVTGDSLSWTRNKWPSLTKRCQSVSLWYRELTIWTCNTWLPLTKGVSKRQFVVSWVNDINA